MEACFLKKKSNTSICCSTLKPFWSNNAWKTAKNGQKQYFLITLSFDWKINRGPFQIKNCYQPKLSASYLAPQSTVIEQHFSEFYLVFTPIPSMPFYHFFRTFSYFHLFSLSSCFLGSVCRNGVNLSEWLDYNLCGSVACRADFFWL